MAKFNFSETLIWKDVGTALGQFNDLCSNPPLHSVVIETWPKVAEALITASQGENRPLTPRNIIKIARAMEGNYFEMTGDTVKVNVDHKLQDGQHRLHAGVKADKPFVSHWVFGLPVDNFDILDEGRKRTAGDVLALDKVSDYSTVAGTIRNVLTMEAGTRNVEVDNHTVRSLARTRFRDIGEYIKLGRQVNLAFKGMFPPSMMAAICYRIGQHNRKLADEFATQLASGNLIGRNATFANLVARIRTMHSQSGKALNNRVKAAMVIQAFNAWNADEVAAMQALRWQTTWKFPTLVFDAAEYRKKRQRADDENTSLPAAAGRILKALHDKAEDNRVQMSQSEIAKASNVPVGQVQYTLGHLIRDELIRTVQKGTVKSPAIYELKPIPVGAELAGASA